MRTKLVLCCMIKAGLIEEIEVEEDKGFFVLGAQMMKVFF